jgi:hypothetical protein
LLAGNIEARAAPAERGLGLKVVFAHGYALTGPELILGCAGDSTGQFVVDGARLERLNLRLTSKNGLGLPRAGDWVIRRGRGLSIAKGSFGTLLASDCGCNALMGVNSNAAPFKDEFSLRIHRPKGLNDSSFRRTCLNVFIPQALAALGSTVLHAACVRVGDSVVLIAGASGMGKSTLAAGFAARGYAVFSDDVVRVESRQGFATAFRGYSGGHLRAGNFLLPESLRWRDSSEPKHWFDFGPRVPGVHLAPVTALYFLGRSRHPNTTLATVSPANAVVLLLRSLFLDGLDRESRSREALRRATNLAGAIPVYALNYRRDKRHFELLMDDILNHAKNLPLSNRHR